MCKTINYIFSRIRHVEEVVDSLGKMLKHQNMFNKSFAVFSLTTAAYMYKEKKRLENRLDSQTKAICELKSDIQRLNNLKGEDEM